MRILFIQSELDHFFANILFGIKVGDNLAISFAVWWLAVALTSQD